MRLRWVVGIVSDSVKNHISHEAVGEPLKLGVIIVNYNSGEILVECLSQLMPQLDVAHQIVVVDNASQDGSLAEVVESGNVLLLRQTSNLGFAAANNIALQHLSDVDLIFTLNPDAFVEAGCINALLTEAQNNPEYDSFACRMMADANTLDGAGDSYHISGLVWRHLHHRQLNEQALQSREVFSACAGAALYRKAALDEVGGFDENFFCYVEDVDLGYRLRLAGKRCLYLPNAVVKHLGSAISSQYPGFATYHGHRNLVWAMLKNTPGPLLILVLPAHLIMSLCLLGVFVLLGDWRTYLRAKRDALKGLSRVWMQRKEIQRARRASSWYLLKHYTYSLIRK